MTVQSERNYPIPDRKIGPLEQEAEQIADAERDKNPRTSSFDSEVEKAVKRRIGVTPYRAEVWGSHIDQAFAYAGITDQDRQRLLAEGRDLNAAATRIIVAMARDQPPEDVREKILQPLAEATSESRDPAWDVKTGHQKSIPRIRQRRNQQNDSQPTLF